MIFAIFCHISVIFHNAVIGLSHSYSSIKLVELYVYFGNDSDIDFKDKAGNVIHQLLSYYAYHPCRCYMQKHNQKQVFDIIQHIYHLTDKTYFYRHLTSSYIIIELMILLLDQTIRLMRLAIAIGPSIQIIISFIC